MIISCQPDDDSGSRTFPPGTFGNDLAFLQSHTPVILLEANKGQSLLSISPALQGRVMTSAAAGKTGKSYGWINRELLESGDTLAHMNAFGGEERFWLGPEGGQFSIFFPAGAEFTLDNWQTPRIIDLDPYMVETQGHKSASFIKNARITNYSGFTFELKIRRNVEIFENEEIFAQLGLDSSLVVQTVGYESHNSITNTGEEKWNKETGLLSIWLLGMFNPSPSTTVVIPYQTGDESELGPIVNSDYFGEIPGERLVVTPDAICFSGDGKFRSKIGLLPQRAKNILGAYDSENQLLTIVTYNQPEGVTEYVNSLWKIQEEPYKGDAVNSYNDGPPSPGAKPLGPFYELETSSPAFALGPGEAGVHIQQTYHFEGKEAELNKIAQNLLGVSLEEIKSALVRGSN